MVVVRQRNLMTVVKSSFLKMLRDRREDSANKGHFFAASNADNKCYVHFRALAVARPWAARAARPRTIRAPLAMTAPATSPAATRRTCTVWCASRGSSAARARSLASTRRTIAPMASARRDVTGRKIVPRVWCVKATRPRRARPPVTRSSTVAAVISTSIARADCAATAPGTAPRCPRSRDLRMDTPAWRPRW